MNKQQIYVTLLLFVSFSVLRCSPGSIPDNVSRVTSTNSTGWFCTWGGQGTPSGTYDTGANVVVDATGNIFVIGWYNGTADFNPDAGIELHSTNGIQGAYLSKFNSNEKLEWTKTWSSDGPFTSAHHLALDESGNIYINGLFMGEIDFDPGEGIFQQSSTGLRGDQFLIKFNKDGDFQYAKTLQNLIIKDIVVAGSEEIYLIGKFPDDSGSRETSTDFDPGSGIEILTSSGSYDAFLAKYDADGQLSWVKSWGGDDYDSAMGIELDASGNIYIFGSFSGSVDLDPGTRSMICETDGEAVFVCQFNPDGELQWCRTWEAQRSGAMAVLPNGDIFIGGRYNTEINFDPGNESAIYSPINGHESFYLCEFDSEGGFHWAQSWGNQSINQGMIDNVAVNSTGDLCVIGMFEGTCDFDGGQGVDEHSSNGESDAFLAKYNTDGEYQWASTWGGVEDDRADGSAIDDLGDIYVTGYFRGILDLNFGGVTNEARSRGGIDSFLIKFPADGEW